MKVLLIQIDGKLPNIALMRLCSHYRSEGFEVELRYCGNVEAIEKHLWDDFDLVFASLIFTRSQPIAERLLQVYPDAIIGGTGWDLSVTLESFGINTRSQDYSIYPGFQNSIGFTQRGCRLKCQFCVVPSKEGAAREEQTVLDIWRGAP